MTNYTKTTNFAAKDDLTSGNANKIVKGTEIDTEFTNIATAVATKANTAGPTFTGTVTIPTVDLNGGAIDGTTVGASTAAAITGTTIVANTSLLVGKTSADDFSSVGAQIESGGQITNSVAGAPSLRLNRGSSDGAIIELNKAGTEVGRIGTLSGDLNLGSGDTGLDISAGLDAIMPYDPSTNQLRDNTIHLGQSSARFQDIYATNGTIQTSDRNEKQDIEALSDAEQRIAVAAKGLLRKYRWKSSVAEKGDDARIHFGIIAQDLQDAFTAEGLDAGRYGMFINSTWTDEETGEERSRMGVRYSELLAFIICTMQPSLLIDYASLTEE